MSPEPPVTLTLRIQSHNDGYAQARSDWGPVHRYPHIHGVAMGLSDTVPPLQPVAGVRVALDRPDGTRLGEVDSDADGLVVFVVEEGMWPDGVTVTATAYRDCGPDEEVCYLMHTLTDIARPSSAEPLALTLFPVWEDVPGMVRVEGSALNRVPDSVLGVGSTAPYSGWFDERSSTWAMETPAGDPFDLVAYDRSWSAQSNWEYDQPFYQWARISSPGLEEDKVLEIDFVADTVEATAFEGTFRLPTRDSSPLRHPSAFPYLIAFAGDAYWCGSVDFSTRARLDGRGVEFTGDLVETPEYGGNWYQIHVQTANRRSAGLAFQGPMSMAYGRGVADGDQPQLLDLPEWGSSAQPHPIDEPLSWEIFDEAVTPYIWVLKGDEVVWVVELPADASSATLPAPPSNVDLAELLGTSPLAMVALERQIDSEEGVFWLESWGEDLALDLGE